MTAGAARMYRAREFAELAGVTVHTLHHYDRLGLLEPRRTDAGYRLYHARDLERLEQIVALKFVGLPLRRIKVLLGETALDLRDALRAQRRVLEQKRGLLDKAIGAIGEAEACFQLGGRPDSAVLKKIIEVIEMQNDSDWMLKYHTEGARAKVEERRKEWTPELQAEASRQWTEMFRDVEAALGEDPAGERAQALVDRWQKLIDSFTGGDLEIARGVGRLYADRANWPADFKQQIKPFSNPAVWTFFNTARAARKK